MVALATLLAAFAGIVASGSAAGSTPPNANKRAAQQDAAALMAALRLPPGAASSSTEPAGGGTVLAKPPVRPATPNLIDDHRWWVVPGDPAAVLVFIRQHPPAGSTLFQSGSGNIGPGFAVLGYAWPARPGVLSSRWLVVETVSLPGGSTGLRADAQDVWIKPRPRSERIPSGVDRLAVSVVSGRRVIQGTLRVMAARRVRRVVALINGLELAQPGVESCPVDLGVDVRLAFYRRRAAQPVAVALVDASGCEGVTLTIRNRRQPPLTSEGFPLISQLDAALGMRLKIPSGL